MSDRLRVGIVGTGVIAQAVHLPTLLQRRDLFEVSAVCDLSRTSLDAAGERCGVPPAARFDTAGELLASGLTDALLVLTSGSHGGICADAAAVGLPVFCEKPLAYTLAEADALARAPSPLAIGYMKLYDSAFRLALDLLGSAPPLRSVEVTVLHPPAAAQLRHLELVPSDDVPADIREVLEAETARLLERALGPAPPVVKRLYAWELLSSVVHDLALVRALAGDPVLCSYAEAWPEDDPASLAIACRLADDVRLSIRWHYLATYPAYTEEVRVHHESGSVQIVFPSPYRVTAPTVVHVVDKTRKHARTRRFESSGSSFETELVAFHRLVTAGVPTAAGLAEGRADIVTCQLIARSLAEARGWPVGGESTRS
jgi:predicted dehydrogenase